ncbi:hypothetical protein KOR34_16360 [Posidoniimonas corsicana]|uniref:Uncharacterized protein n=1 Tax=Posidoniimonas corsicana TaxID=1938618 RepID=A0A5C5VDK3_9BACT|nr:hypothetical protein [Posidoniimonas corsicana]TWT36696.1 hypothetical protein KOR34_16360 [Posidoniimonas corsicana]
MPSDATSPPRTIRRSWRLVGCALALLATLGGQAAPAQSVAEPAAPTAATPPPVAPPPTPKDGASAPPKVPAPAGPDTTIWIDDAGVPRPVVGVTYDEFAKAWRAYQGSDPAAASPRFTLNEVDVRGRQENGHAAFDVTIELELLSDQPVEAPIGFGGAVLDKKPTGLQPTDAFGYSDQAEAYAVTLSGKGPRTIGLSLLTPIRTSGQANELSLSLPRAILSKLQLQLSGRATDVAPIEGALLEVDQAEEGARLSVTGGVGPLRLRWRSPDQTRVAAQTVLDAEGEITSTIDSGGVKSTAVLRVRSFGGEFDRFQVRLPAGAKRIPVESAADNGVRVEPSADGRTCTVLLSERTVGPVTVEIATERAIGSAVGSEPPNQSRVDLAGFEVLGAVRQEGYHAVIVDEDTRLRWFDLRGARRVAVEDLPASLATPQPNYAVRCFRPQGSIPVEVRQRETRIQAAPSYHLEILPDVALLHVSSRYQIIGAPILDFGFDLNGWTLSSDPIEPAELVDATSLGQDDDGTFDFALLRPRLGNVTVGFHARSYALTPDGDPFEVVLPQPRQPASYALDRRDLLITVDPSLWLTIDPRTFEMLEPAPSSAADGEPTAQQTFRFRDDAYAQLPGRAVRLYGVLTRRAGELHANAAGARVTIAEDQTSVEQSFYLEVRKQPRERIEFDAPPAITDGTDLAFYLLTDAPSVNDARVTTVREQLEWRLQAGGRRVVVELPRPWSGALNLVAGFRLPSGADELADEQGSLSVPLMAPTGVGSFEHDATIESPDALTLRVDDEADAWQTQESSEGVLRVVGSNSAGAMRLTRVPPRRVIETPTVVTRVWRQSWRRGATLQQRSAWRVLAGKPEVLLTAPPSVTPQSIVVQVDGQPVRPEPFDTRTLRVPLPQDGAGEHTVEARRVEALSGESGGQMTLRPLQIQADTSQAMCYWQVVLPSDLWMLSAPEGLRPAWRAGWRQGRFRRLPVKDSAQLESWVGATHQDLPLDAGERAYLYSALALPEGTWRVTTIDQKIAVLATSLLAMAIGLVIGYSPPRVRHVAIGLLCVLILLFGYWRPADLAMAAQAGAIGLVALFAGWVAMLTLSPGKKTLVTLSDDSTSIRHASTNQDGHLNVGGGTVSTNAPTVSLEVSNPLP